MQRPPDHKRGGNWLSGRTIGHRESGHRRLAQILDGGAAQEIEAPRDKHDHPRNRKTGRPPGTALCLFCHIAGLFLGFRLNEPLPDPAAEEQEDQNGREDWSNQE